MSIFRGVPGCGMQWREPAGVHGKSESNSATGSWVGPTKVAFGVELQITENLNTLMASNGAPYGPSSSWVPTM